MQGRRTVGSGRLAARSPRRRRLPVALSAVAATLALAGAGGIGVGAIALGATPAGATPASARAAVGRLAGVPPSDPGNVLAWGADDEGQVGDGVTEPIEPNPSLVQLPAGVQAEQVAEGAQTGYALGSDGNVYAWGNGADGELGDDTDTADQATPVAVDLSAIPVADLPIVAVAAGTDTAYLLDSAGDVWAFGDGSEGQLGDGSSGPGDEQTSPVEVSGFGGGSITAIAAGGSTAYALDSGGDVWAWGDGSLGQLADGNSGTGYDVSTPEEIDLSEQVTGIAAGIDDGYAVDAGGNVWSWGDGDVGQLGDGESGAGDFEPDPQLVDIPGDVITSIGAGGSTGYALDAGGNLYAWGNGVDGELGNGSTDNAVDPEAVTAPAPGVTFSEVSGSVANGYALGSDGNVYVWGFSGNGELGDGLIGGDALVPQQVPLSGVTFADGSPVLAAGPDADTLAVVGSGTIAQPTVSAPGPEPTGAMPGRGGMLAEFRANGQAFDSNDPLHAASDSADSLFAGPPPGADAFDNGESTLDYVDADPAGDAFNFGSPPRDVGSSTLQGAGFADDAEDPNFAMRASGYFEIPTGGNWVFDVRTADAFNLSIEGQTILEQDSFSAEPGEDSVLVTGLQTGLYSFQVTWAHDDDPESFFQLSAIAPGGPEYLVGDPGAVGNDPSNALPVYQDEYALDGVATPSDSGLVTPAPSSAVGDPSNTGSLVEFREASAPFLSPDDPSSPNGFDPQQHEDPLGDVDALFQLPVSDSAIAAAATDDGVATINYADYDSDPTSDSFYDTIADGGTMTFPNGRDVGADTLTEEAGANGNFNTDAEDDFFGMEAHGYLYVPQAGDWSFDVRSDDGFELDMGEGLIPVMIDDNWQGPTDTTVTVTIPQAGYYPYLLTWFQGPATAECELSAEAPGASSYTLVGDPNALQSDPSQTIATYEDLVTAPPVIVTPEPAGSVGTDPGMGVEFRKSTGSLSLTDPLGSVDTLFGVPVTDPSVAADATDDGASEVNYIDLGLTSPSLLSFPPGEDVGTPPLTAITGSFTPGGPDFNFGMEATGYLQIPTAGDWTFAVKSDDGARLVMGTNDAVVDLANYPRAVTEDDVTVDVPSPGLYPFTLTWFQIAGGALAELMATPPLSGAQHLVGDPALGISVFQDFGPPTAVPESPAPVLLPALFLLAVAAMLIARRRRRAAA